MHTRLVLSCPLEGFDPATEAALQGGEGALSAVLDRTPLEALILSPEQVGQALQAYAKRWGPDAALQWALSFQLDDGTTIQTVVPQGAVCAALEHAAHRRPLPGRAWAAWAWSRAAAWPPWARSRASVPRCASSCRWARTWARCAPRWRHAARAARAVAAARARPRSPSRRNTQAPGCNSSPATP